MHQIRFAKCNLQDDNLLLEGSYFKGKISLLQEGIWRIFIWHRREDQLKTSWILRDLEQQRFEMSENENRWLLQAAGSSELSISLDPFCFHWEGLETTGLKTESFTPAATRSSLDNKRQENFLDIHDGRVIGAGLTLAFKECIHRSYYGLGERTGYLNKKGRVWKNWTADEGNHRNDIDPLYQAHPFIIGLGEEKAFGIYLDETWFTSFDLAAVDPEMSYIHTDGPTFDLYLLPGPTPKNVLQRYGAMVGHAPMPPLWALGYHQCRWGYPNQDAIKNVVNEFRERQIPLDSIWLDIDYMKGYKVFSFANSRFPDIQKLTASLRQEGVRTVVIVDPGVKKEEGYEIYENGHRGGYFVEDDRDQELVGEVWPKPVVWPDFIRKEVRSWWADLQSFYVERGIAGIWNDMNEPSAFHTPERTLPYNARHGEHSHSEVHNLYGYLMCQATYEGLKKHFARPFVLSRSGFAGIQKYAWVWTGDNRSLWEHLEMSIPMILNMGMSGIPFSGADIGGFSGDCDGELMTRWMWLGAFYPFMRNHSCRGSRRQEPWSFGEPYTHYIQEAIRFRYRILPYIYTLAREAVKTGFPIMRPLFFEYPYDTETRLLYNQFLLGKDLLVAPVTRPGQTRLMVYFPEGEWEDFWDGQHYRGCSWSIVETPLDRIPIFQKVGSAIPLLSESVLNRPVLNTDTAFWESLIWRVVPGPEISGKVYEDQGESEEEGQFRILSGSEDEDYLLLRQTVGKNDNKSKVSIALESPPRHVNTEYVYENQQLIFEIGADQIEILKMNSKPEFF